VAQPETIAAWIVDLADGTDDRGPLCRSTINLYLSAVMQAHHTTNHPFDRKHPLIARTWKGISRKKAKRGGPRKAKPIMGSDLRDLITGLDPAGSIIDARDAALLVLGWAAALRRSELVGSGSGYVQILERGLVVTLPTSKGSRDEAVENVISCPDMPTACDALARWARVAELKPG
jgi:site-specific recombinase XerC